MFERRERGGSGASVITADEHYVGVGFGNARGDGADSDLRDEFDGDARLGIYVLQVVNQLGEIFDGVDVVMRRRGDESDAGRGMAHAGDFVIDLVPGQLAAFTGLSA